MGSETPVSSRRAQKKTSKVMTASEFKCVEVLAQNRLSAERIEVARRRLVEGVSYEEAGRPYEWSKQRVLSAVKDVLKVYKTYQNAQSAVSEISKSDVPEGWVEVTLVAPKALIEQFKAMIEAEKNLLKE